MQLRFVSQKSELLNFQKHNWDFYFSHLVSLWKRLTCATRRCSTYSGKLCVVVCIMIIPLSISFYMGRNNTTCSGRRKRRTVWKLAFNFGQCCTFVPSSSRLPNVIWRCLTTLHSSYARWRPVLYPCRWLLCNISISKSSRTASVIIFTIVVVAIAALVYCCCYCSCYLLSSLY